MIGELRRLLEGFALDLEPKQFFIACANVVRLAQSLDVTGPDVDVVVAADSEVDDLLVNASDELFEPAALAERNAAMRRYALAMRQPAREAAARLLRKLDDETMSDKTILR